MKHQVHTERFPGQHVAVVKRRATKPQLGQVIPEACGTVWNTIKVQGIKGAGRHVAVYFDQEFNIEVGVEVESPIDAVGEVVPSILPAGEVATTTHFGPYQRLGEAHDAIQAWCNANGRVPLLPCWETYGHWLDEWNKDPSKIRTDVYYLLQ